MSVPFPSYDRNGNPIVPSARSFTIGEYPTKSYRSLSGAIVKRSFGNRPTNYTLSLQFSAVSQDIASQVLEHYHGQQGVTNGFTLPATLFAGYTSELFGQIQWPADGSNLWFYEKAPEFESLFNGLTNISVNLVSELTSLLTLG